MGASSGGRALTTRRMDGGITERSYPAVCQWGGEWMECHRYIDLMLRVGSRQRGSKYGQQGPGDQPNDKRTLFHPRRATRPMGAHHVAWIAGDFNSPIKQSVDYCIDRPADGSYSDEMASIALPGQGSLFLPSLGRGTAGSAARGTLTDCLPIQLSMDEMRLWSNDDRGRGPRRPCFFMVTDDISNLKCRYHRL